MADGLSIAASVAGIVQLSGTVFKLINKFVKDAKDAPSKVRDLAVQTRNLAGILENLKLLASSLDEESSKYALKAQHLNSCRHTLLTIEKKLRKSQDDFESGKLKALSRRLKWPFEVPETNELLTELAGHCSILQLALSADSMDALLKCLAKQDEVRKMIERKLSIDTRVHVNMRRKEVIGFFLRVNPQDNFQMSLNLRHPMTGLWLTESDPTFQRWKELPNAKLWLSGIPGGGKTVLCGAVIETILQESDESTAVCFAFCDYKDTKTHQPENILAAIAVQLGQQKEGAFDLLEKYFDELNSGNQLQKQPRREPLLKIIRDMASMFEKVYVIVDGLDECGENISSMVQSLTALADSSQVISAAFFSRKEDDIKDELEDNYDQIEIEAHTEDLKAYTLSQIGQRKSLKKLEITNASLHEEIFRTLVESAHGMFRWVACQIDHISELPTNKARRKALKELPPTLFATYDRVLERVRKCPPGTQAFVRKVLHWISLGFHWITIPELCEAISIEDGLDSIDEDDLIDETEVSRRCGCLIRKSVDGKYFELSHFTVMEYLQTQSSIGEFHYMEIDAFRSFVETALRFLLFPCFDRKLTTVAKVEVARLLERNKTHPFYHRAASLLGWNVPFGLWKTWSLVFREDQVLSTCKILFDLTKRGSFMLWCLEIMIWRAREEDGVVESFDRILGAVLDPATTPLHMAVWVGIPEVCHFLLQQGADANSMSRFGTPMSFVFFTLNGDNIFRNDDFNEILGMLLDYGADTTLVVEHDPSFHRESPDTGSSALAQALREGGSQKTLQLIRPSTQVLDDAINFVDFCGYISPDVLQAILKISTGADAPLHWQPMASPALLRAKKTQAEVAEVPDNVLGGILNEEYLIEALEFAIRNGLVDEVSALIKDPRLYGDPTKWESTVRRLLRITARINSAQCGRILALLIDSTIAPDVVSLDIQTCFFISCKSGHADTAQLLLARGARFQDQNVERETAWDIAAARGDADLLRVLLSADSNVSRSLSTPSNAGMTPLCSAVASGSVEASLLLMEHCPPDLVFFQSRGLLLHSAAKTGSQKLFAALLASGVELEPEGPDGSTPLHHLGASCSYEFVQYLTLIYDPFRLDHLRRSPFEKLLEQRLSPDARADHSKSSTLDLLIPPNFAFPAEDGDKDTPHLWESICNVIGRKITCPCEVERYDWNDSDCRNTCKSAFGTCFRRGVLRSYEHARNESSAIPLISALLRQPQSGRRLCAIVILFLFENAFEGSALASTLKETDSRDRLFRRIILRGELKLTEKVLGYGLDVHCRGFIEGREDPISSLEAACLGGHFPTFKQVLAAADLNRLNEVCPSGHNLIDQVVRGSGEEKMKMIQALFDKGVKLKDESDCVALAAKRNDWDMVKLLVELGGSMFVQVEDGWAAVHFVVRDQDLVILKSLLELTSVKPCWNLTCQTTSTRGIRETDDGVSLLHLAAWGGKDDMIEYFLDKKLLENINISAETGETPLHCAAEHGKLSTCKLLVRSGAKLDISTSDGNLPINYAIQGGHMETAQFLLETGSPSPAEWTDEAIRGFTIDLGKRDESFKSNRLGKLLRQVSLEKAILDGDLAACKSAITNGCSIHEPLVSCHNCTPLFAAIRACKEDVVEWLLEQGASLASVYCYHNKDLDLPQHAARVLSSASCLSKVLSASLENGMSWYSGPASPIYIAVDREKADLLEAVLNHIQENIEGYRYILKPHLAGDPREISDLALMSLLINQAGKPEGGCWETPLHRAVRTRDPTTLKLLIQHGANVNAGDAHQETPLMFVSRVNGVNIARELLDSGASIESRDINGFSAIVYAVFHGHLEIVKLLEEQSPSTLDYLLPHGGNLLSIVTNTRSRREIFEYLISRGLDPGHCDRFDQCAFDRAMVIPDLADYMINSRLSSRMPPGSSNPFNSGTYLTNTVQLRRLFKSLPRPTSRVFIDLETKLGLSPLCEAAHRNLAETVALLLDLNASIELESLPFGTPLMYAAVFGKLDVVKLLVRRGAKLEYTNTDGVYRSAHVASAQYPDMNAWLLRGRFQDQPKLTGDAFWGDAQVRCWSGRRAAQVKIKSCDQRRWKESTLDYCKRFWHIRKGFAGRQVVGVLV
ncbi:ankyrin repeat-containing domain protein [Dactylonectria macrodidyma]|uniref:Ankyrin repeat-containing domain protein n=1 Tax=Dactylonectria macrodidyma TaxID=307937 RepID=A0A9P9J6Z0_9HYPO|nr:ankyrin repeat-containing domain protein [Dactylonectria macrodidyma]